MVTTSAGNLRAGIVPLLVECWGVVLRNGKQVSTTSHDGYPSSDGGPQWSMLSAMPGTTCTVKETRGSGQVGVRKRSFPTLALYYHSRGAGCVLLPLGQDALREVDTHASCRSVRARPLLAES